MIVGETSDYLRAQIAKIGPVLNLDAKVDLLLVLVDQIEKYPSAATLNYFVNTEGGAFIEGSVKVDHGGIFVGRDDAIKPDVGQPTLPGNLAPNSAPLTVPDDASPGLAKICAAVTGATDEEEQ